MRTSRPRSLDRLRTPVLAAGVFFLLGRTARRPVPLSGMPSIADLERLLATNPADAFVLYGLAQEHAKAGNTARAVEFYDRCLAADRAYCYAYFHKAKALEAGGRVDEAMATLRAGVAASRAAGDAHAASEIAAYLDELAP